RLQRGFVFLLIPPLDLDLPDGGDDLLAGPRRQRGERQASLPEEVLRPVARSLIAPGPDEDVEVAIAGLDRDRDGVLVLLQSGIYVVSEPLKNRAVGHRGDKAPGQDNDFATNAVGQRAEDDEEEGADDEGNADQKVGIDVIELEVDQQEEQRVELPGVPDHSLSGSGTKQRERHVLVVWVLQKAVFEGRLRTFALRLHPPEDRRLV